VNSIDADEHQPGKRYFEHLQKRHYGMKLMASTLINVRHFCGT
jgi:hypothetical protein